MLARALGHPTRIPRGPGHNGGMTGTGVGEAGAVFVLPVTTAGQRGPVAAFVSTAGWANAARRVVGASWIVTPSGATDPDAARATGTASHLAHGGGTGVRSHLPAVL